MNQTRLRLAVSNCPPSGRAMYPPHMTNRVPRSVVVVVAVALAYGAASLVAQGGQKRLTLNDIYEPGMQVSFSGSPAQTEWFDDATYLVRQRGTPWRKVSVATGESTPLADVDAMEKALAALPGVARADAAAAARGSLEFDNAHTAALVTIASDLFYYQFASGRATRLTNQPGDEELATFSPNGRTVAFVRAHNLYAVDVADGR